MIKRFWLVMIGCILIGAYLRFENIENNPPHLGNDEISIAYDSYSVRMIGRDEHGNSWPLSFESHRTYKAPLYAYLNMLLNLILGNTALGVRGLSVLSSLAMIVLIGLIGKSWGGESLAIIAMILLTLNPKNISVSRIAFEANLAASMMLLGLYFMIRFRKNNEDKWLILSGIFFGLSIWGYHTQWGLTPLLAIVWPWLSRKEIPLKRWWKMWLTLVFVALPIFINFLRVAMFDPNNRASSQMWFKDIGIELLWKNNKINYLTKITRTAMAPVSNYIEHFGINTNFSSGLLFADRQSLDSGWNLLVTLPLVIVGLFGVNKFFKKWRDWFWSWWLLCPVIPALTTGGVSSVRNLAFIIPTIMLAAIGLLTIYQNKFRLGVLFTGLVLVNFYFFYKAYYVHFPIVSGDNFQYGYAQAWEYIRPISQQYDHIIVEPKFGRFGQFVGVPHLYFGYYGAFGVEEMQNRTDINGTKIGKFEFRTVDWNNEALKPNSIYVVSVINPMAGKADGMLNLLTDIKKPDFEQQFLIYETK